jgi:hypothetical protein
MKITITNCRYAPSWNSLQQTIREATNEPTGVITLVDRRDKGIDYRQPGKYRVGFRQSNETILPIELEIVGVSK